MNARYSRRSDIRGASAYAAVGLETDVLSADRCRLISLLFEGLDSALASAGQYMRQNDMARKGELISKALEIVNMGLLAAVDRERGGAIAEQLIALYEYIGGLLVRANRHNDHEQLELARRLLADLGAAWREVEAQSQRVG